MATATSAGTGLSVASEKAVAVTKEAAPIGSGGNTNPPSSGNTNPPPISGGTPPSGDTTPPTGGAATTPVIADKPVETIKDPIVPLGAIDFTDLESVGWAKDAIKALANKGILGGKAAGQFDPSGHITRAEFAAIAVRLLKIPVSDKDPGFMDTNGSDWFMKEVKTAVANGLLKGADGKFNPNGKMTRQEIATIIGRILLLNKITLKSEAANPAALLKDAASIASWALEGAKLAMQEAIITGQETTVAGKKVTNFAPLAPATRAEAAVMLYRLAAKVPTNLQ